MELSESLQVLAVDMAIATLLGMAVGCIVTFILCYQAWKK